MTVTNCTPFHRLRPLVLGCLAALVLIAGGSPLRAQTVAVMVNGEPITNYDIEQRGKLNFLSTRNRIEIANAFNVVCVPASATVSHNDMIKTALLGACSC